MRSASRSRAALTLAACAWCAVWSTGSAWADGPREHVLLGAIRSGDLVLLESLLREGVSANVRTHDGTTPLMVAALHGTPEAVEVLLRYGADPKTVNDQGATALLFAAGDARKVQLLIDVGADVNARSALGNTPLLAAAAYPGNLDSTKLLVARGADVHAKNQNDVAALAASVMSADAAAVRYFLSQGCQPLRTQNLFGAGGNSLLELAASTGDAEIVELLLDHGVDVNSSDSNFAGHALNYALLSQQAAIARRLIDAGADLTLCSPVGKVPPIVLASYFENGDTSVTELLVERGAATSAASQQGETALTWAHRRGFPKLIALLEQTSPTSPTDPNIEVPNRTIAADASERDAMVRSAIERSIALLQRSSDVFLENRRCTSCHHQNLPGVALGWARDRGFAVDATAVNRMVERNIVTWAARVEAAYEMDRPMPVPPQLLGYGLWGLSALGHSADSVTDAYGWYLAAIQQPDGHWGSSGITRPPIGGSDILSTALALRALQLYPLAGRREESKKCVQHARSWLAAAHAVTHQDLVFKLIGLAWAGTPAADLRSEIARLQSLQRSDGGWAQLPHLRSDAWATGESLVALRLAGDIPSGDSAYQRGVEFLLRTQFDDGSWYVQARAWPFQPPFDSGFPFGRDQWISAGATAWATMALLIDAGEVQPAVVPSKSDPGDAATLAAVTSALPSATSNAGVPTAVGRRTEPVDFARDIKPVLERSCAGCHSGETPQGGYVVLSRDALLRGGESGETAVLPGRGGQSPLIARVAGSDPDLAMPPQDKRDKFPALTPEELQAFRAWIDAGALWPEGVPVKPPEY